MIGVVAILIDNKESIPEINSILSNYAGVIRGRMGVPSVGNKDNISVISLIVEINSDELGALTGKLGNLEGVTVKSAFKAQKS